MALAALGAVSAEHVGAIDPLVLDLTTSIAVGTTVVVPYGGDSNSIAVTSVSDSKGNTWSTDAETAGQGMAGVAWCTLGTALTSSDTITINFSGSNDCMARAYAFTGIDDAEDVSATKTYTESATYSLAMTASDSGVMFVCFSFPFDFFTADITGWTRFASIADGTDQQLLAYYKEVSAGSNTASKTLGVSVGYLAAGMVLPYGAASPPTTTTPPPGTARIAAQVISFF